MCALPSPVNNRFAGLLQLSRNVTTSLSRDKQHFKCRKNIKVALLPPGKILWVLFWYKANEQSKGPPRISAMTVVQNWFMSVQLDLFNRCNLHSCNYYYYKRKPWSHADWTSWPPQCFALSAHNHASFFFFFFFFKFTQPQFFCHLL